MLVGAFSAPDDPSGGTGRVETSMGFVTLVGIAELLVDLGVGFCNLRSVDSLRSLAVACTGYESKRWQTLHTIGARFSSTKSPHGSLERCSGDARLAVYRELAVVERHD